MLVRRPAPGQSAFLLQDSKLAAAYRQPPRADEDGKWISSLSKTAFGRRYAQSVNSEPMAIYGPRGSRFEEALARSPQRGSARLAAARFGRGLSVFNGPKKAIEPKRLRKAYIV